MLKRIAPFLLALVFICQVFYGSAAASPTFKFEKQTELRKTGSSPLGTHFDFTIEDEELDEDESQEFTDLSFLGTVSAGFKTQFIPNSRFSKVNSAKLRTISANREFTCVYTI